MSGGLCGNWPACGVLAGAPMGAIEKAFAAGIGVVPDAPPPLAPPAAVPEPELAPEPAGAQALLLPVASPASTQGVVSVLISTLLPGGWLTEIVAFDDAPAADAAGAADPAPAPPAEAEPEAGEGLPEGAAAPLPPEEPNRVPIALAVSSEFRYQSLVTEGEETNPHSRPRMASRKGFQSALQAGALAAVIRTLPGVEPMFCTVNLVYPSAVIRAAGSPSAAACAIDSSVWKASALAAAGFTPNLPGSLPKGPSSVATTWSRSFFSSALSS